MIIIIILPLLICVFNIYRRLTCVIKVKMTKYSYIGLALVLCCMLYINFSRNSNIYVYIASISWWLAFFTSLISSGLTQKGIMQPWNLFSKIYPWDKMKEISIEKKKETFMLTFKVYREMRQEYSLNDMDKVKKFIKLNKKK